MQGEQDRHRVCSALFLREEAGTLNVVRKVSGWMDGTGGRKTKHFSLIMSNRRKSRQESRVM